MVERKVEERCWGKAGCGMEEGKIGEERWGRRGG